MKNLASIMMGILFAGTMAFICDTSAIAGPRHPGGHHRGYHGQHHRAYWGYGPGIIWTGSPVVAYDECYTVKRCRINRFGERRCRLEQICE